VQILREKDQPMKLRLFIPVALLMAGLTGCSKNAAPLNSNDSLSVSAEDPIKDVPINATTHYAAGQLAESRGDFENALLQYKFALNADPKFHLPLFRIGCVYAEMKNYPKSVETWRQYLKATKDSATGYSNLAFTEELAGNPAGAEADYKKGIAKDPTNEPCRINYGLMLARNGRIGEATVQLQAVLSPAEVHYNLATVYELQHRKEQAKIEYRQALALDPNFADAREKLASLGDYADED
jgi:tetratricopeptide (TPR) repeat protein